MYEGCIVCCTLVSHVEYLPHALVELEKRRDRQTDRRSDVSHYLTLATRQSQHKNDLKHVCIIVYVVVQRANLYISWQFISRYRKLFTYLHTHLVVMGSVCGAAAGRRYRFIFTQPQMC